MKVSNNLSSILEIYSIDALYLEEVLICSNYFFFPFLIKHICLTWCTGFLPPTRSIICFETGKKAGHNEKGHVQILSGLSVTFGTWALGGGCDSEGATVWIFSCSFIQLERARFSSVNNLLITELRHPFSFAWHIGKFHIFKQSYWIWRTELVHFTFEYATRHVIVY